ncbi:hypothetical protein AF6_0286 [Anoxybacillus flavithermus TNO-09.006]|uniref:Uncharacterized protein n=1 Tax=Anoxybacillus flavithermus TaxID=33934 RepID=A0A178T7D3_9BACL|nr:hypothetical protein [Anoxybacillus flavithermus]ASA97478.1 hypothetical protein CA592_12430 [Anoxybacillus flavithermus]ELK23024.1 hypothetical protein AF6_0286 [Anoxybacillus flavithermus TNO-09.006]MBE2907584.1 hypothetical protein [Anoxybacillus flavithermus]MBE2910895.1 hypothetical protein [Anoxybacillus flavithermus]MBE2915969.1 hypothetical protein [Anoxybacillus flavithermus]
MEHMLQRILDKLEKMGTELEEVKANMATKQDLALVQQAVIETNEIVKKIESRSDNHEKLLTFLSHRSLEHEAAICSSRSILTK